MPIDGDFNGLEELVNLLDWAASDDARSEMVDRLAYKALEKVEEGFEKEQDPYGAGWAPKKYHNGRPILVDTGEMKDSFSVSLHHDGFTIRNNVDYAGYHQDGTTTMPARKMVPDDGTLGDWEEDLREEAINFYVEKIGRVR